MTMSSVRLVPIDRPDVAPLTVSGRMRSQLVYFMSASDAPGVPTLGEGEFFFADDDIEKWLDEGVIYLVSPLDTANYTEVELSEEQELFLNWLKTHQVRHVKVLD